MKTSLGLIFLFVGVGMLFVDAQSIFPGVLLVCGIGFICIGIVLIDNGGIDNGGIDIND